MMKGLRYLLVVGYMVAGYGTLGSLNPASGALLDGLMGSVEESLGKRAQERGNSSSSEIFIRLKDPIPTLPSGSCKTIRIIRAS